MRCILIILFTLIVSSCKVNYRQKIDLTGTVWECEITDGCINTYKFTSNSTFLFLSCEMEDEYFGYYYFKNGYLMIDQIGSINEQELFNSSEEATERKLYKVKITETKLKHLSMSYLINEKWILSDFKFDAKYIYKKIDSIPPFNSF